MHLCESGCFIRAILLHVCASWGGVEGKFSTSDHAGSCKLSNGAASRSHRFQVLFSADAHTLLDSTYPRLDKAFHPSKSSTRSGIRWTASAVIRLDMRWDLARPLKMVCKTRKPPSERCHTAVCSASQKVSPARYHVFTRVSTSTVLSLRWRRRFRTGKDEHKTRCWAPGFKRSS